MTDKPIFLFLNFGGDFEAIAQRVKAEGYPIKFWIAEKPLKGSDNTGKGIFSKDEIVEDFWEIVYKTPKENLIILSDDSGHGWMFDSLRRSGYTIIGASAFCDKIEHERDAGTKLFEDIGIRTPKTHIFENLKEGIRFLEGIKQKDDKARFVFKPNGEEYAGSSYTYTGKNVDDLIEFIQWVEHDCQMRNSKIEKFELQEFIDGYEADFSFYFDGEKAMEGSINLYVEEKKVGDGNKGQAVGCMGCVTLYLKGSKYFDLYLSKLVPYLKKVGYIGQISINNIFSKEDGEPRAIEFTPRFGWDAQMTEGAIIKSSGKNLADFYLSMARKEKFAFPHDSVGCGVRVYCRTPGSERDDTVGRRFSFEKTIEDNLWFYSVSYDEKTRSYMTEDGCVLVANSVSPKASEAIKGVYDKVLPKLYLSDVYYRTEIGKRFPEVVQFLTKYGWL